MCSSQPGGILGAITKLTGKSPLGGAKVLSSGGFEGLSGASGLAVTKSMLGQRRKASKKVDVPLLGNSGEEVNAKGA
jgi:hypothetical protein